MNHRDVSATSGTNVAEHPSKPINTPCAIANCIRLPALPAIVKPIPSAAAPPSTGTITPNRSESLPIRIPPSANPSIVSV
ncbi:hypothetical protein D3C83_25350 [compost metagenome]